MLIGRRKFLQALGLMGLAACSSEERNRNPFQPGGIRALDWALAETMVALGHPPAGVVAAADWARFVVEPALPAGVADLGLQQELNLELMAALRPARILISPFLAHLKPILERIAPTLNLSVYETGDAPMANRIRVTHELASHIGAEQAAARLVLSLESRRTAAVEGLSRLPRKPVLLVSFIDNRHARVYAGGSLYADVLAWLGLDNAWSRPVGRFGFSTVGIEELALLGDIELIAVEPVPPDISRALSSSPLWTELPFVRAGQHGRIPPVFMFGALPSAARMVDLLVPHLRQQWQRMHAP